MSKTQIKSLVLRQITNQAKALNISLLDNVISSIDYQSLMRDDPDTHKGSFGTVAIIGGNCGMHGALYLAGRAAMLCGAGKVVLGPLDKSFTHDLTMPELVIAKPKDILKNVKDYQVLVIGPGLGQDEKAQGVIRKILDLHVDTKMVFDADALNLIAANEKWHYQFRVLKNKIITPHPKEAARLLNQEVSQIIDAKVIAIKKISEYYNSITLLKGHASLIHDGKELFINSTGNAGLSNAGQGDTLCGIVAAFIAQGMSLLNALRLGVLIHGKSADELSFNYPGLIGIVASEVALKSRELINQLVVQKK